MKIAIENSCVFFFQTDFSVPPTVEQTSVKSSVLRIREASSRCLSAAILIAWILPTVQIDELE